MGAEELYLDHLKFRANYHDVKICDIMKRELPNVKAPAPRPTGPILLTSICHTVVLTC